MLLPCHASLMFGLVCSAHDGDVWRIWSLDAGNRISIGSDIGCDMVIQGDDTCGRCHVAVEYDRIAEELSFTLGEADRPVLVKGESHEGTISIPRWRDHVMFQVTFWHVITNSNC